MIQITLEQAQEPFFQRLRLSLHGHYWFWVFVCSSDSIIAAFHFLRRSCVFKVVVRVNLSSLLCFYLHDNTHALFCSIERHLHSSLSLTHITHLHTVLHSVTLNYRQPLAGPTRPHTHAQWWWPQVNTEHGLHTGGPHKGSEGENGGCQWNQLASVSSLMLFRLTFK